MVITGNDNREKPTMGLQPGVCWKYFDVGLQPGYQDGPPSAKIVIYWELSERLKEGEFAGKRFLVHKEYTKSIGEKSNLRKDLQTWRGAPYTSEEIKQGIELDNILGKNCTLNLMEDKNGYPKVTGVFPPTKGTERLTPETPHEFIPRFIQTLLAKRIPEPAPEDRHMDNPKRDAIKTAYSGDGTEEKLEDAEIF